MPRREPLFHQGGAPLLHLLRDVAINQEPSMRKATIDRQTTKRTSPPRSSRWLRRLS